DATLTANLRVLRNAIDLFSTEHNNAFPTAANIVSQLTEFSDAAGVAQAAKDATHIFGPYVRDIPALPVGAKKGSVGIAAADAGGIGWIFDEVSGTIKANTTIEQDAGGKAYNLY
ncbi:MAG: hypothetical protein ACREJO_05650, partial [Phycisphaerales bacterium]